MRPEIWLSDIWEIHKCKCEEITKYITSVKIILTVFSIVEASIQNALKDCGLWKPSLLLWKHHSCSKSGSIIFAANEKFAFVLISYQDVADNSLIYTLKKKCIQNIQFFKNSYNFLLSCYPRANENNHIQSSVLKEHILEISCT